MSFASPIFLWYFVPAVLLAHWILPSTWRNGIVALVSLLFYTWGAGPFVFLLLAVIAVNYAAGLAIDSNKLANNVPARRTLLISTVTLNLAVLMVWKYAGFATQQANAIAHALGVGSVAIIELALPIGISFYTFHHISYVVDVYRRSRRAQKSIVQFTTYIAMFPQLIAGPIVRYHEISEQLCDTRRNRFNDFAAGFPRFALGLCKKVIIADSLAPIADAAFAHPAGELNTATAWIGAIAFTLQIYFDFSGYSDMAIGLGVMLGFRLPDNFHHPYSAYSITDFWRRWHMSLSRWFRDYVYIPLGGNRTGKLNNYRNLLIIFILCGFWHGANWTFLIWGLYHGTLLIVERVLGFTEPPKSQLNRVLRRGLTFSLVVVGWVPFRSATLDDAAEMISAMFTWRPGLPDEFVIFAVNNQRALIFALAIAVVFFPPARTLGDVIDSGKGAWPAMARTAVTFIGAPYAALLVAAGTFSPFLYYQF